MDKKILVLLILGGYIIGGAIFFLAAYALCVYEYRKSGTCLRFEYYIEDRLSTLVNMSLIWPLALVLYIVAYSFKRAMRRIEELFDIKN